MLIQIKKVATLATKADLNAEQDKVTKLQAFDSSYFRGKSHFEDDGIQNYLVFQPMYRYFKGLSDESIKPILHVIMVLLEH